MKRILFCLALIGVMLSGCQSSTKNPMVEIETRLGTMEVMLYNSTPIHRDNFLKLAEEGFYDSLLFHRVIPGFMIQGGDPESRDAATGQRLGMGGPGYQLDAEIGAPHIRGALAAARDNNPQKRSSGSQFYIVTGSPVTDDILNDIERRKGITYNEAQRELYKELGGTPQLDQEYTVFGEVVSGIEVADAIANEARDATNRPFRNVRMTVRVLNR